MAPRAYMSIGSLLQLGRKSENQSWFRQFPFVWRSPANAPVSQVSKGFWREMRFKTLIVGYALALALLLFAQRHPDGTKPEFSRVLDLTHTLNASVPTYEPPTATSPYQ